MKPLIYFRTENNESRGDMPAFPVPFFVGMKIRLHGYGQSWFKVVDFHLDNTTDKDTYGLVVTVKEIGAS